MVSHPCTFRNRQWVQRFVLHSLLCNQSGLYTSPYSITTCTHHPHHLRVWVLVGYVVKGVKQFLEILDQEAQQLGTFKYEFVVMTPECADLSLPLWCSRCMGDRVISQRASVEVTIPKGVWDPYTFEFLGFGSQSAGKTTGAVKVTSRSIFPTMYAMLTAVECRSGHDLCCRSAPSQMSIGNSLHSKYLQSVRGEPHPTRTKT